MVNSIWKLNKKKMAKTNLALYSNFLKKNYKTDLNYNFDKIWKWSIDNPEIFWKSVWKFTKVKGILGKISLKKSKIFF